MILSTNHLMRQDSLLKLYDTFVLNYFYSSVYFETLKYAQIFLFYSVIVFNKYEQLRVQF